MVVEVVVEVGVQAPEVVTELGEQAPAAGVSPVLVVCSSRSSLPFLLGFGYLLGHFAVVTGLFIAMRLALIMATFPSILYKKIISVNSNDIVSTISFVSANHDEIGLGLE